MKDDFMYPTFVLIGLLCIVMWMFYHAVQKQELLAECFGQSEWIVYERTTNRVSTDTPNITTMSWDFELHCVAHPHIKAVYNAPLPTWAMINQTVTFQPRVH